MEPVRAHPLLVNMGGYSDNFRPVIAEAVERLEAATGLLLIPVGDTTFMPTSANQSQLTSLGGELVIALGDELQTDLVPGLDRRPRRFILYFTSILRASVVIDMGAVGDNPPWTARRRSGLAARTRSRRRSRSRQ